MLSILLISSIGLGPVGPPEYESWKSWKALPKKNILTHSRSPPSRLSMTERYKWKTLRYSMWVRQELLACTHVLNSYLRPEQFNSRRPSSNGAINWSRKADKELRELDVVIPGSKECCATVEGLRPRPSAKLGHLAHAQPSFRKVFDGHHLLHNSH